VAVLRHIKELPCVCIPERMPWAARLVTTRREDIPYSLMGLFGVYMPVPYCEGGKDAFRRLQLATMETSFDHTLLAWRAKSNTWRESSGLLRENVGRVVCWAASGQDEGSYVVAGGDAKVRTSGILPSWPLHPCSGCRPNAAMQRLKKGCTQLRRSSQME
jgi:hypothetical protein